MAIDFVQEVINSADAYFVGKKLVSVTRRIYNEDVYLRWTFENGGYTEWHQDVLRKEGKE